MLSLRRLPTTTALILALSIAQAQEPLNLGTAQTNVKTYYNSGRYERDLKVVIGKATRFLKAAAAKPGKKAIVFDIDDTCLSNYPIERETGFGFVPYLWNDWAFGATAPAIQPTLGLYQLARAKGVDIFFITGRKENLRSCTEENLRRRGFGEYAALLMKPESYDKPSVIPFKSGERKKIAHQGYRILASVGDQWSDLKGGYAERIFKLPNPMYFIP